MKARLLAYAILALLLALPFAGCATATQPTPEQLAAYGQAISGLIGDYKTIKAIQRTP